MAYQTVFNGLSVSRDKDGRVLSTLTFPVVPSILNQTLPSGIKTGAAKDPSKSIVDLYVEAVETALKTAGIKLLKPVAAVDADESVQCAAPIHSASHEALAKTRPSQTHRDVTFITGKESFDTVWKLLTEVTNGVTARLRQASNAKQAAVVRAVPR